MTGLPPARLLPPWLSDAGPESAVALSSRVRLARNLENAPFPSHARPAEQKMLLETVFGVLKDAAPYNKGSLVRLADASALDRRLLMERLLISNVMAETHGSAGVALDPLGAQPVMVNEEDHLRLSAVEPGFQPERAWERLNALDDALGGRLSWAYHERWGFLTSCPTNCGTGLRVSVRLHLPGLSMTGQLRAVLAGLQRLGLAVRGFYGEGTHALADVFQISNVQTLGRSEPEILQHASQVIKKVIRHEQQARDALFSREHRVRTEDLVHRALGVLKSARILPMVEALTLLSRLRLGVTAGLRIPVSAATIGRLLVWIQPGHVRAHAGERFEASSEDRLRAELVRRALTAQPHPHEGNS